MFITKWQRDLYFFYCSGNNLKYLFSLWPFFFPICGCGDPWICWSDSSLTFLPATMWVYTGKSCLLSAETILQTTIALDTETIFQAHCYLNETLSCPQVCAQWLLLVAHFQMYLPVAAFVIKSCLLSDSLGVCYLSMSCMCMHMRACVCACTHNKYTHTQNQLCLEIIKCSVKWKLKWVL